MGDLLKGIEYLGVPMTVAVTLVSIWLILHVIGFILDIKGKVLPEIINIRGYVRRKKEEKKRQEDLLERLEKKLASFEKHYSKDNIEERNKWMDWVNGQAEDYNTTLENIDKRLGSLDEKLEKTTVLAEKTRLDQQRQQILDFAARVNNPQYDYSKEHFRKVFKQIREYEAYIETNNLVNGEIDHAIEVIEKAYEEKKNSGKIVW
jgi:hypothetical protein